MNDHSPVPRARRLKTVTPAPASGKTPFQKTYSIRFNDGFTVDTLILDSTNWSFDTSAMTMPGTTSSGGGPYLVN
jgi:hypothetical protein